MSHLTTLLSLKLTGFKNAFGRLRRRSRIELVTLCLFFSAVVTGLFVFFLFSFRFFQSQEPFGPILVDETFYLFTFAIFIMLYISTAVSGYASLFRSGEVPFLLTRPPSWSDIYFLKLSEAVWYSSWALLLVALPFMTAYGLTKNAPFFFPFLCFLFYIPFIILAGTLGTLTTVLLIRFFPDRKRRKLLIVAGLAALAFFFVFRIQPGMVRDQGSLAGLITGYLPHVSFAKHPLLPSSWVARGVMSLSHDQVINIAGMREAIFYFLLLLSNMLFFFLASHWVSSVLYPRIYLVLQDHDSSDAPRRKKSSRFLEKVMDRLSWPPKPVIAFLEKDLKTFVRDPSEWSQMIIFFGLLLLYFANLKNLEFHILKSFWKNIVFILNTVGTYIVLSSFSMRFIFPMISLEGSRFWIINLSPVRFSQLLLEKFLLGTVISAILTVPLIFFSGWMLEISPERVLFTTGLGFFVCIALTGLSVGFGAKFPNFKSTHPSEILSGFGGSLLLFAHLAYLTLVGVVLVRAGEGQWWSFGTLAAVSLLIAMIPLNVGMKALSRTEF